MLLERQQNTRDRRPYSYWIYNNEQETYFTLSFSQSTPLQKKR
jgi:hypothetical protein